MVLLFILQVTNVLTNLSDLKSVNKQVVRHLMKELYFPDRNTFPCDLQRECKSSVGNTRVLLPWPAQSDPDYLHPLNKNCNTVTAALQ